MRLNGSRVCETFSTEPAQNKNYTITAIIRAKTRKLLRAEALFVERGRLGLAVQTSFIPVSPPVPDAK